MAPQSSATKPVVPGYEIREYLGSGGYGEVWKAIAPGAIEKAIKFVYGYHDQDRAARELKALNRIKEVRHPFLLSLDRIEVVDGQVVIVTELADRSLKDRMLECRDLGAAGIPRDELLTYMRDTADALDYMSQNCSLQHLDVKPENLLLLGGRVKVADFGLVRDVHDVSVSLMGGLTPVYAPPELFEGRPGLRSDQYSLAIVYQETLTGVLPFTGTTAAQLMAQHIHGRPEVSPLPPADRATIARALSKEPEDRFPSCRAMVDCLQAPAGAVPSRPPAAPRPAARRDAQAQAHAARGHTQAVASGTTHQRQESKASPVRTSTVDVAAVAAETVPEVADLPPVQVSQDEVEFHPALFLGIGGTAASTLRRLRRRLNDRFGNLAAVPAFQMLLLDTDLKAILRATQGDRQAALQPNETVAMPLRRTQDYRADTDKYLAWLSRRWLYNIPRSLQTEGRRPLGRVALVDHAQRVFDRVRAALQASTSIDALAASSEATGYRFHAAAPRVYLVASISGGTGSGMVLDMAYAIRKMLADVGLLDDNLRGVLMHSTSRDADARDLAIANAYACLKELHHCSHPSLAYPGAPECGIAAADEPDRTFPATYLVHLGDRLSDPEVEAATDDVAQYLYLDAATPAGTLLDKCRALEPGDAQSGPPASPLRSFGVCRLGGYQNHVPSGAVDRLCADAIGRLRGDVRSGGQQFPRQPSAGHPGSNQPGNTDVPAATGHAEAAIQRARQLGLEFEPMLECVDGILQHHLDGNADTYCRQCLEQLLHQYGDLSGDTSPACGKAQLLASIDAILASATDDPSPPAFAAEPAASDPTPDLSRLAVERGQSLCASILELVDTPGARLGAAGRAADQLAAHLRRVECQANETLRRVRQRRQHLADVLPDPFATSTTRWWNRPGNATAGDLSTAVRAQLKEYLDLKFQEHVVAAVLRVTRQVASDVATTVDRLTHLQHDLNALARQFDARPPRDQPGAERGTQVDKASAAAEQIADYVRMRWPKLTDEFTKKVDEEVLRPYAGLSAALAPRADFRAKAVAVLRDAARDTLLDAFKEINVADLLFPDGAEQEDVAPQLRSWLTAATPRLLVAGGAKRLVLMLQNGTDAGRLETMIRSATEQACSAAFGNDGDVVFCYEVEQLPLANVVAHMTDNRADYAVIASRLHTRVDVAWTPLDPV